MGTNTAPTFTTGDGVVTTRFTYPSGGHAAAIQSDGRIVVVGVCNGDIALARYNVDGSLDFSFSSDGKLTDDYYSTIENGNSIAVQSDGKILVAGFLNNGNYLKGDYFIRRYNFDGSLDANFGFNGITTTDFGWRSDDALKISIQYDNKIVVSGVSNGDFSIARYNLNGSLDTSFSDDGILTTDVSNNSSDGVGSAVLQANGKIVAAGWCNNDFAIVRYNTDGSFDTTFSDDGILTTDIINNSIDAGESVVLQPDGKIVVLGTVFRDADKADFAIVRYNEDGSLDTSFSEDGKVIIDIASNSYDLASGIVLQSDGKILVSGSTGSTYSSPNEFSVARLNIDGSLDLSFSNDGKLTTDIGNNSYDKSKGILLQIDGKIVVVGTISQGDSSDFALVRYKNDGRLDDKFDEIQQLQQTLFYVENGGVVALDDKVLIYDNELSSSNNYAGASVKLSRRGGANNFDNFFSNKNLGLLTEGSVFDISGVIIGSVLQNSNGILNLVFNNNADQVRVNEVLSCISYANTSDNPEGSIQIDWTFSDGNTGAQGVGGALTTTGYTTVNITPVNDAPVGKDSQILLKSTSNYTLQVSDFSFTDAEDGSNFTAVKIESLPNRGSLRFDGANMVIGLDISASDLNSGLLTYTPDSFNTNATFSSFQFKIKDSGGLYDSTPRVLNIAFNSPPMALSTNINVDEDSQISDYLSATDINGGILIYTKVSEPNHGSVEIQGNGLFVYKPASNYVGTDRFTFKANDGFLDSAPVSVNVIVKSINDAPSGGVIISGEAIQGQELRTSNTLTDIDGLGVIRYQWFRESIAISNATSANYVLTQNDVGQSISVAANYTDANGSFESIKSLSVGLVKNVNDTPQGAINITGDLMQGARLKASNNLTDADGIGKVDYQWFVDGNAIQGATGDSYELTEAEVGKSISVRAEYIDGFGFLEKVFSNQSDNIYDVIDGSDESQSLIGTEIGDVVSGFGGNDLITGGLGRDILNGGSGSDTFVFSDVADSSPTNPDVIIGFEVRDKIDLSGIDANINTTEDDVFRFINSERFTKHAAELRLSNGLLQADVDGDGVADFSIELQFL